ncbi:MAG TPA: response regulator [Ramlibacter sp.]|uniref:response regulator n=1 Tax=Ramlibacter sp. TaxID=1917967 RepID=UPI002CFF5572|nr:response regulator [Ramlibacter sp.]HVZ43888.1 response regulator [Ramlibacter sp.]
MEVARKKILIVDDDPAVLALLVTKIGSRYYVVTSSDSSKALEMARHELPDAILCDIDMPGLTGGDVAAQLKADPKTAGIPLVYLTSMVSPEETKDMGGLVGGRPGVSKRAPLAELVRVIDRVTGGPY